GEEGLQVAMDPGTAGSGRAVLHPALLPAASPARRAATNPGGIGAGRAGALIRHHLLVDQRFFSSNTTRSLCHCANGSPSRVAGNSRQRRFASSIAAWSSNAWPVLR